MTLIQKDIIIIQKDMTLKGQNSGDHHKETLAFMNYPMA